MPIIIIFSVFMSSLSLLAQERLPEIVKKVQPSTVVILTYNKEGKILGQGSGFFISKNHVITSRHVLLDASRAEVKIVGKRAYHVKEVLAEDKEGDIILISVDIPFKIRPLSISTSVPEVGEQVIVIGGPLGLEKTVSDGIVSAVREIPEFGKIIQITAPISPGSSGSPVVNMKGEVIGVASFQIVKGQNLNFAIPAERVAKLTAGEGRILTEWQKATEEERIAPAVFFLTGLMFLRVGDYEKALSYFEKAVEKNPKHAEAYFQIGYCYYKFGLYTKAINAYKQAIRIRPDHAGAHLGLGLVYLVLGDRVVSVFVGEYETLKDLKRT
jgi:hypothetical protein